MEIYRNAPTTVKFKAPISDGLYSIVVKSPQHESLVTTVSPVHDESWNTHTLSIPVDYQHTWYDGEIDFAITVNSGTQTVQHTYHEYVNVVTPLFTYTDLGSEYPAQEVPELERLVRKVVEAYTNQVFGKTSGSRLIDTSRLTNYFNVPIIEFTGIGDRYLTGTTTLTPPKVSYEFVENNFGLRINWGARAYDIKTDSTWLLTNNTLPRFVTITGTFGYNYVPEAVKEAALLIAGVWGCKQAVWRDRFIETMRSADWSVKYDSNAFGRSTGSITADQLLDKYVRRMQPEVI